MFLTADNSSAKMMEKNIIYSSDACPFCQLAYQLLADNDIAYQKILISSEDDWQELMEKTGKNTVPQVFINDVYVGGFNDLSKAQQSGRLDEIING